MIEQGLVRRELERALIASARAGRPASIEIVVRDATVLIPEAVRLQASDAMQQFGLADVPLCLLVERRRCGACGWHGLPRRGQLACPACGARLAAVTGRRDRGASPTGRAPANIGSLGIGRRTRRRT